MGYGIQNKNTKKWIEIVYWNEDGTTAYKMADRDVGGVWLKRTQDAEKFMKEHKISQELFKVRSYKDDENERWFKRNEDQLLKIGYYRNGWDVYRPDGSILYET